MEMRKHTKTGIAKAIRFARLNYGVSGAINTATGEAKDYTATFAKEGTGGLERHSITISREEFEKMASWFNKKHC